MTDAQGGEARLRFATRAGGTILRDCYTRAPLHVREVQTATRGTQVLLLTTGGGLLGDDRLRIDLRLEEGAMASVGTVGATRLLAAHGVCRQELAVQLDAGSRLVYLPEPLIPCTGAVYESWINVEMAPEATAILGEVITPGRLSSGERFAYHSLDLGVHLRVAGKPLLVERLRLVPSMGHLPVLLGAHTHVGSLLIAGAAAREGLAECLHTLLARRGVLGGATYAAPGLVVVRVLGAHAHLLQQALRACTARVLEENPG